MVEELVIAHSNICPAYRHKRIVIFGTSLSFRFHNFLGYYSTPKPIVHQREYFIIGIWNAGLFQIGILYWYREVQNSFTNLLYNTLSIHYVVTIFA